MQEEIKTRGWEMQRVCYTEFVYVEYNDCNGFTYEDPEYGLGFGTECRKVGNGEPVERCHDELFYVQEPLYPGPGEGGGNGGGNGGNGGYVPIPPEGGTQPMTAPNARKIFSGDLTEEQWKKLENMLKKIINDCMGEGLYKELSKIFNSNNKISFNFSDKEKGAKYSPINNVITFNPNMESGTLLHEMMHAYQYKQKNDVDIWRNQTINSEIESHYTQYLYYCRDTVSYNESDWIKGKIRGDKRMLSTEKLEYYIDKKGNFYGDSINFEIYWDYTLLNCFKTYPGYENYKYTPYEDRMVNFNNLRKITENCI